MTARTMRKDLAGSRRSLGRIWALPLLVALTAHGKDEGPLPLMKVSGASLESPALNFRVEAPDGWSWSEDREVADPKRSLFAFKAQRSRETFFSVMVAERNRYTLSEQEAFNSALGGLRTGGNPGAHPHFLVVEPRSTPFGAGFNFSYTESGSTDRGGYSLADGVLFVADRIYCLLYFSSDRELLGEFNSLARSFALVRPVDPNAPPVPSAQLPASPRTLVGKATGALLLSGIALVFLVRMALVALRSSA